MADAAQPVERLPLPAAYTDRAFMACLGASINTPEIVENFDRLHGCSLAQIGKGKPVEQMIRDAAGNQVEQLRKFTEFVHDGIYMRVSDDAIRALRAPGIGREAA